MIIDEYIDKEGVHQTISLKEQNKQYLLCHGLAEKKLNPKSLDLLFNKFGYELDPSIELKEEFSSIADLGSLHKLRFKSPVDADFRDYLVWKTPKAPPQAGLARQIASGLCFMTGLEIDHPYYN